MSKDSKGGGLELVLLGAWIGVLFCSPFTPSRARVTLRALLISGSLLFSGVLLYEVHDIAVRIYHLEHQNGAFIVDLLAFPIVLVFPYLVISEIWGEKFFNSFPDGNLKLIQYLLCFAFYSSIINFLIVQLPK